MATAAEALQAVNDKSLELRHAIETLTKVSGKHFTPWAPHFHNHQVQNCVMLPSRYHLLDRMPKGAVCIELGTQEGNFAREILDRTKPSAFHVVDLYVKDQFRADRFEAEIASGLLKTHEGDTSTILATFPDKHFDWIYIDGDHSYPGVKKDLAVAVKKIKDGGLIACNDYTAWSPAEVAPYGIMLAVNELCREDDWELVYFAFQGQGTTTFVFEKCARPADLAARPGLRRGAGCPARSADAGLSLGNDSGVMSRLF